MSSVASWAVVICIAAVICGVLELLSPSTKMNGILRFVFGGFMLCAIIIPLSDIDLDFSAIPEVGEMVSSAESSIASDEKSIDYVKSSIANLVEGTLKKIPVTAEEISIDMDIDEDNCINMITVRLKISAEDMHLTDKVKQTIQEELGLECRINE